MEETPDHEPLTYRNGKIVKTGFRDARGDLIKPGDLFVVVNETERNEIDRFRWMAVSPSRSFGFNSYVARKRFTADGTVKIRLWRDAPATGWDSRKAKTIVMKRLVGHAVMMVPGIFGTVLGRHELRSSQWHVIIGTRHLSSSNRTMLVVRNQDDLEIIARQISQANKNVTPERWKSVMAADGMVK